MQALHVLYPVLDPRQLTVDQRTCRCPIALRRAGLPGGMALRATARTTTMAYMEITCITVDCVDPVAIASFWDDALGWGGVAINEDGSTAICGPKAGGCYLEFVRVPEAKVTKNRVHLGCSADALDSLDAEILRLCQLGATVAWEEAFAPGSPRSTATSFYVIQKATSSASAQGEMVVPSAHSTM